MVPARLQDACTQLAQLVAALHSAWQSLRMSRDHDSERGRTTRRWSLMHQSKLLAWLAWPRVRALLRSQRGLASWNDEQFQMLEWRRRRAELLRSGKHRSR